MIEACVTVSSFAAIIIFLYLSAHNQQAWRWRLPAGLIGAGNAMIAAGLGVGAFMFAAVGAVLTAIGLMGVGILHFWR